MTDINFYILAGGQGSRFGGDKARATLNGQPAIVCIANVIRNLGHEPVAVAQAINHFDDLQLSTITDRSPGQGPLGGIQAALHHCAADWCMIISCDYVGLRASWLEKIVRSRSIDRDAVAFRHDCWEPLMAAYRVTLLEEVDRRIASGQLSPSRLLDSVNTLSLDVPEDWSPAAQFNTRAELELAQKRLNAKGL